ncbi:MAG: hypothetical protein COY40_05805 [Alphaproteobacteria bacterium CG_4_10_14_0_8_um_filter_53_9]|nr:MAG: hypothetical protein COY40_05805 [Alphaproteobacteria bacterium CG_4_10_14_0_8_um_filter_53_9]
MTSTTVNASRSFTGINFLIGIVGIAALIAAANYKVPIAPVPLSLQTFIVLGLAITLPWRIAASVVASYVMLAFVIGQPVAAGEVPVTGGYLLGFIAMAALMSWVHPILKRIPSPSNRMFAYTCLAITAHVIVYAFGLARLHFAMASLNEGWTLEQTFTAGALPFLTGDLMKCVLFGALAASVTAFKRRR